MKEWGSDPDVRAGRWLWLEAAVVGASVMSAHLLFAYFLATILFDGLRSAFNFLF